MYPSPPTKQVIDLALPTVEALQKIIPGWEWVPEYRDVCVFVGYPYIFTVIYYNGEQYDQVKITDSNDMPSWEQRKKLTPILDWEKIIEIIKDPEKYHIGLTMGYEGGRVIMHGPKGVLFELVHSGNLQEVVMRAVIRLGEELK